MFDPSCAVRLEHMSAAKDPTATALVVHAVRHWIVPAFQNPSPMVRLAAVTAFVELFRRPLENQSSSSSSTPSSSSLSTTTAASATFRPHTLLVVQHDALQAALRASLSLLELYEATEVAQPFVKELTTTLLTWSHPGKRRNSTGASRA